MLDADNPTRVNGYTKFFMPLGFPNGHESCQFCPACKKKYDTDLRFCDRTGEILLTYKSVLGEECPLIPLGEVGDLLKIIEKEEKNVKS